MRFELQPKQEDGGGDLYAVAETIHEVQEFLEYFKPFPSRSDDPVERAQGLLQEAQALQAGHLEIHKPIVNNSCYSSPYAWYEITGSLTAKRPVHYYPQQTWGFLDPYKRLMKDYLAYDLALPDMELTQACDSRLCHTHIVQRMWLHDDVLHFVALVQSGAWQERTAKQYAEFHAYDYIEESIGGRSHESEFLCHGSTYTRNPHYATGKHHPPEPAFGAPWLWLTLFRWWREKLASPRQREILDDCDKLHKASKLESDYAPRYSGQIANFSTTYTVDSRIYYADPNGTINWDGKGTMASVIDWKEFAKL